MSEEELPQLTIDTWYQAVPPAAVPVPAVHVSDLDRAHAIVTLPGHGTLYDMRVLGHPTQDGDGRRRVNVVPELDYWRTRLIPGAVVHPQRYDLEHLWVEHRLDPQTSTPAQAPADGIHAVFRRRAPRFDQPGARTPVPCRTVPNLHGRRVIQSTQHGFLYDLRAISDPVDVDGDLTVNLVSAQDYHHWLLTGQPAAAIEPVPLYVLWTE